ncbi:MAG: protein translocase subunit SecD [Candidatus Falkowbacteria bacterium]
MPNILQKIMNPSTRGKIRWVFVLIILLTLTVSLIDAGQYYNRAVDKYSLPLPHVKEIPFRLGLDLLGGTHLVYEANVSDVPDKDKNSAVEGARDVIERRVNVFGVSEPIVQVNKTTNGDYRVIVELAGVQDVKEAIQMIGETPLLEFKEEDHSIRELTDEEKEELKNYNIEAEKQAEEILGKVLSGGDFSVLAGEDGDLGWITEKDNQEIFALAEKIEIGKTSKDLEKTSDGYEIIKVEDKRSKTNPFNNEKELEIKAEHLLICFEGTISCKEVLSKEDAYDKIKKLKEQATPENFSKLAKENSTEPGAEERGGSLGWFRKGDMVEQFDEAVFSQEVGTISDIVETDFGYHLIHKQEEREIQEYNIKHIFVNTKTEDDIIGPHSDWANTELTGKNLERATVQFNPNDNSPEVSLEFDDEGSNLFAEITDRNVGKKVAIFLDSYPISIPTVNEKITGGRAVISGNFNIKEAKLLAQRLNAGALPVPINLINQQTVGASLGHESVANSLKAGMIGLILVAIFMILFYRLPGLVSVFSLAIYGLLVLAVFKLWPVTLTLSGLAGFILSIGMAVDANVLIFERLKEELRAGKPIANAIDEGFMRAWPSIRDGNISTLITCFILIQFSTSVVKGFAITLGLGVMISMFSAIVITRSFLRLIAGRWLENKKWILGIK